MAQLDGFLGVTVPAIGEVAGESPAISAALSSTALSDLHVLQGMIEWSLNLVKVWLERAAGVLGKRLRLELV
ncbi:hypothetical protein ACFSR9_00635 [Deinococcus taklimakanensis]|uniref:Uncharacterized protein n=1 Tax=Deinococcus taklimakanensis TaxID=536443 RepID=A0ABW5P1H9_9DEIO